MEKSDRPEALNRRKLDRVAFTINLALTTQDRTLNYSETHDISTGGIFVVTDDQLDVGTTGDFVINLTSGGNGGVEIKGRFEVVSHSDKDGVRGMGIHFKDLDPDSSIRLYRIVRYNLPVD